MYRNTLLTFLFLMIFSNFSSAGKFGYRYHDRQTNPGAFFYTATGQATFGPLILRILAGEVTIPEEGLIITASPAGRVEGRINGEFVAREWARIYPNFNMDIYVHTLIETDDGHRIAFDYTGTNNPDDNDTTNTIITSGTFSTGAEPYLWVNGLSISGSGSVERSSGEFTVEYHETNNYMNYSKNRFRNGRFRAASPRLTRYKNRRDARIIDFLVDSDFANTVYAANLDITEFETFGTDLEDLVDGTAFIPSSGLRFNSIVEGSIEGLVAGTITGIDFLTINQDGTRDLSVRVEIIEEDGSVIEAHYTGLLTPSADLTTGSITLRASHFTDSESQAHFNNLNLIGAGTIDFTFLQIDLEFFELDFELH